MHEGHLAGLDIDGVLAIGRRQFGQRAIRRGLTDTAKSNAGGDQRNLSANIFWWCASKVIQPRRQNDTSTLFR